MTANELRKIIKDAGIPSEDFYVRRMERGTFWVAPSMFKEHSTFKPLWDALRANGSFHVESNGIPGTSGEYVIEVRTF